MRRFHAAIGAAAILIGSAIIVAAPIPANRTGLVVHEWGTFSSFSGSDGVPAKFYADGRDLPSFVHSSAGFAEGEAYTKLFTKGENAAIVSLETPVLYFYTDRPLTATVRADFPTGAFTEWFPQAGRVDRKRLTWTDVRVRPAEAGTLATEKGPTRYYAAREVDAAPLMVVHKIGAAEVREHERFLFYRGVGDPALPLTVRALGRGEFSLQATGEERIAAAVLVEARAGRVRFRPIDPIPAGATARATLPAEWDTGEPVRAALVGMLVQAGLFGKEAQAMVKTWESAWLGTDGTRVLYFLPAGWTDRTLPLKVTPSPDTLVRVLLGRHDVLTPERELEIDGLARQINGAGGSDQKSAEAALAKLGRFAWPARQQAEQRLARRR
jgi:hypothetical protein